MKEFTEEKRVGSQEKQKLALFYKSLLTLYVLCKFLRVFFNSSVKRITFMLWRATLLKMWSAWAGTVHVTAFDFL